MEIDSPPPPPKEALFLQDSSDDEEEDRRPIKLKQPQTRASSEDVYGFRSSDVVEVPATPKPTEKKKAELENKRQAAKVDWLDDDSDDDIVILSTPEKPIATAGPSSRPPKRKASPRPATSKVAPPPLTQASAKLASFDRGYIGSFYCSGIALSKGKGYITSGASVVVERNKTQAEKDQEKADREKAKGKTAGKATTVIKNGKVIKGGGTAKQSTLSGFATGKKAATTAKPVKKVDAVVRFNNDRGFEVGRLPAGDAAFISPLLDPGMIELTGTVVDAPASLTIGCDILLNLKVFLTRKAFEENVMQAGKGGDEEERSRAGGFWQQQGETEDEKRMRLRKAALGKLFSECAADCIVCFRAMVLTWFAYRPHGRKTDSLQRSDKGSEGQG
jgi:DNA repair protein RAD5